MAGTESVPNPDIDLSLDGKVALITGGGRARGQGRPRAGCSPLGGRPSCWPTWSTRRANGRWGRSRGAEYAHLDVTSEAEWDAAVADIVDRHGRLDILVNNVGVAMAPRLVNATMEDWHLTIAVNQTGVFLGMRAGARAMIEAGNGGVIVNISSVAGMEGLFGSMAYGASKWAVRGMTKVAAKELGKHGIRANSIHPGFIDTDRLAQSNFDEDEMARSIPIGRIGTPEGITGMVLYLVSGAAGFVTGQEFVVDGGWHG